MKAKLKISARGSDRKLTVTVEVESLNRSLVRREVQDWKRQMQNRIFQVVRDDGFDVAEIKVK